MAFRPHLTMSLALCIGYASSQQANLTLSGALRIHFDAFLQGRTSKIKDFKTVKLFLQVIFGKQNY